MSYTYDSSIMKKTTNGNYFASQIGDVKSKDSDVAVFNVSQTDEAPKEEKKEIKRDFDIDALIKKYKKDPSKIFDELGLKFTDKQKAELAEFLDDKKSLKSFLSLVKEEALTEEDIVAGIAKLKEMKPSGFFARIGNFFKKLFKEGFAEAFKLAKSERVYKAQKLGENMNDIRTENQEYSSEGVADIAHCAVEEPEIKDNIMHFVTKKDTDGTHLYDEDSSLKATHYMADNTEKADEYTANAAELEAIIDDDNKIKYDGSTIVNTTERMTEKPELKNTMMEVAHKSDMSDEYLDEITQNLFDNPDMEESIHHTATAKASDGSDRYTASNVCGQSKYLVNKNKDFCESYTSCIKELSQNENLSSDQILEINKVITEYPEIRDKVLEKVRTSNISGADLVRECNEYAGSAKQNRAKAMNTANSNAQYSSNAATDAIKKQKNNTANNILKQNGLFVSKTKADTAEKQESTNIRGVDYPRKHVLESLYKLYGPSSEKILQKLEADPGFIELIKKYGNQRIIVEALVKDPTVINKLKNTSSSISTTELAEMLSLCKNQKSVGIMADLTAKYGAAKAIKMVRDAQINNTLDETSTILAKSTIDSAAKKKKIEDISSNKNYQRSFIS